MYFGDFLFNFNPLAFVSYSSVFAQPFFCSISASIFFRSFFFHCWFTYPFYLSFLKLFHLTSVLYFSFPLLHFYFIAEFMIPIWVFDLAVVIVFWIYLKIFSIWAGSAPLLFSILGAIYFTFIVSLCGSNNY